MENIGEIKTILARDKELTCLLLLCENLTPQIFPLYSKVSVNLLQLSGGLANLQQKFLARVFKNISNEIAYSIATNEENDFQKALEIFKSKARRFVTVTDALYCLEDLIDGMLAQISTIEIASSKQKESEEADEETAGESKTPTATNTNNAQINQKQSKENFEKETKTKTISEILGNDARNVQMILMRNLNGKAKESKDSETTKFFRLAKSYTGKKLISPDEVERIIKQLLLLNKEDFEKISNLLIPAKMIISRIRAINSTGTQEQLEKTLGKPIQQNTLSIANPLVPGA